jgi:hypothetical protein
LDVNLVAAGRSGSGHGVVCPKQETTLRQSIECHIVRSSDFDSGFGGIAAFQPIDSAEVQFGGDPNHHPCARQFFIRRPLQGFSILQKRLSEAV